MDRLEGLGVDRRVDRLVDRLEGLWVDLEGHREDLGNIIIRYNMHRGDKDAYLDEACRLDWP